MLFQGHVQISSSCLPLKTINLINLSSSSSSILNFKHKNMNRMAFLKHACRPHYLHPHHVPLSNGIPVYGSIHHPQFRHFSTLSPVFRNFRGSSSLRLRTSPSLIISQKLPPPSSKTNSFKNGFGILEWYLNMVKARPILTKSITCSIIYAVADFSSQSIGNASSEPYDLMRSLRMAGYGMIVLGPTLNYWFNLMANLCPRQDIASTLKKMAMGQFVLGPIMTVLFFSLNAAVQGETGAEVMSRLKRDLLPTFASSLMYWPMCDFVTFRFFPVHLQPLLCNSFSYFWTIYMTYMANLGKNDVKAT